MQLSPNTSLQNGKYRIIRVIGQGGFGITYLAENVFLNKNVAIKEFFPKDFCRRDRGELTRTITIGNIQLMQKLKERFLKEAKNISILNYPGIIKIFDVFEENGTAYYIMEYVEGETLSEMVKKNGALSPNTSVEYIKKIGKALEYIHSKNMTHFDVKPSNIMIRRSDNEPILIDFGLSKQYDSQGEATSTLLNGISQGYSPLELYNAGSITTFSPKTDIYSLGATFYFMLTAKTPPAANLISEGGLTFPTGFPKQYIQPIKKAMAPSRAYRLDTVSDFLRALSSERIPVKNSNEASVIHKIGLITIFIGLIISLIGVGVYLYFQDEETTFLQNNHPLPLPERNK